MRPEASNPHMPGWGVVLWRTLQPQIVTARYLYTSWRIGERRAGKSVTDAREKRTLERAGERSVAPSLAAFGR